LTTFRKLSNLNPGSPNLQIWQRRLTLTKECWSRD